MDISSNDETLKRRFSLYGGGCFVLDLLVLASSAIARPTSPEQARPAVRGWLRLGRARRGLPMVLVAALSVALCAAARGTTYFVNDGTFDEPGSVCTAAGDDANNGGSPGKPMRHVQALLDRHSTIGKGDTVRVDPGTYVENLWIGKAHSGLTLVGAGANRTTIDGDYDGTSASEPCIILSRFKSGLISGFTIRNGGTSGTEWPDGTGGGIRCVKGSCPKITKNTIGDNRAVVGGGIACDESSPRIVDNWIAGNYAVRSSGGIACYRGSSPMIKNNTITGNIADYDDAGGIGCNASSPRIINNKITGNACVTNGGGIYCIGYYVCPKTIKGNRISRNYAFADGGGIYLRSTSPTITDNTISGNWTFDGGGICCWGAASPTINDNTIVGNEAYQGGGIWCDTYCKATITNNTISGNCAGGKGTPPPGGGGIYSKSALPWGASTGGVTILNNTITGNRVVDMSWKTAYKGGGVLIKGGGKGTSVTNCILWDNSAGEGPEIAVDFGLGYLAVRYSDVAGGKRGAYKSDGATLKWQHNIDANPRFARRGCWKGKKWKEGSYKLTSKSRCIDSAHGKKAPKRDKDGRRRRDYGKAKNTGSGPPWADMGAYEFKGLKAQSPALSAGPTSSCQSK